MKKKKILILILIFISLVFVSLSVPFSKAIFKSLGSSTSNMTASKWEVSLNQTGINNNVSLVSGVGTEDFTLKVRSNSEVDAKYSIVIGNIPSGVEISLDGGNYATPTDGTITFTNAGTILYSSNNKEKTHTLTFRTGTGTSTVSNRELTVDVIIEQFL